MGLDALCNDTYARFGSYSFVNEMHIHLLIALKDYLELEECDFPEKDEMISILVELIAKKDDFYIPYKKQNLFRRKNLDGFFPLIAIDDQGYITSYEAKRFLETYDIVREYVHHSLQDQNTNFYMQYIFEEAAKSDESITFS